MIGRSHANHVDPNLELHAPRTRTDHALVEHPMETMLQSIAPPDETVRARVQGALEMLAQEAACSADIHLIELNFPGFPTTVITLRTPCVQSPAIVWPHQNSLTVSMWYQEQLQQNRQHAVSLRR